ncbi:MAG: SDR family NAD(P)-dependent oxidoreductase, partial [Saprospiraceae bacterium]|nr:SDR family NAD(P)-dependent oxidoreductase [Saprospiraceae bacterium]
MKNNLKGKVAYITGGSKGIGLGIAASLASEGVNVAISSRNLDELTQAAESLQARFGIEVFCIKSDVTIF